jgi:hypothetical protein
MADYSVALVGFFGVIIGGYLKDFVAEDFRRFRDSQALAGALSGELQSHAVAMPVLLLRLNGMLIVANEGNELGLPETEKPTSPIFEANVARIGLLGPKIAGEVAAVYEQINGFRAGFVMLAKYDKTFTKEQRSNVIADCLARLETAHAGSKGLLDALNQRAHARYWDNWLTFG